LSSYKHYIIIKNYNPFINATYSSYIIVRKDRIIKIINGHIANALALYFEEGKIDLFMFTFNIIKIIAIINLLLSLVGILITITNE